MAIPVPESKPYQKCMGDFRQKIKVKKIVKYHRFVRSYSASLETYFLRRNWKIIAFHAQKMSEEILIIICIIFRKFIFSIKFINTIKLSISLHITWFGWILIKLKQCNTYLHIARTVYVLTIQPQLQRNY